MSVLVLDDAQAIRGAVTLTLSIRARPKHNDRRSRPSETLLLDYVVAGFDGVDHCHESGVRLAVPPLEAHAHYEHTAGLEILRQTLQQRDESALRHVIHGLAHENHIELLR